MTAIAPSAPRARRPVPQTLSARPGSRRRDRDIALGELEAFVQVVDSGGFTIAARTLHLSQPGLSSRIIKLERKVGAVLIDRSSRRLTLTPAGRTLLPRVRAVLCQMDEAVAALSSGRRSREPSFRATAR